MLDYDRESEWLYLITYTSFQLVTLTMYTIVLPMYTIVYGFN